MNSSSRVLITRSNLVSPDPSVERTAAELARVGFRSMVLGWNRAGKASGQARAFGRLHLLHIEASFGQGLGNLPQLLRWQWGQLRWMVSNRHTYDIIHACDFDSVLPSLLAK